MNSQREPEKIILFCTILATVIAALTFVLDHSPINNKINGSEQTNKPTTETIETIDTTTSESENKTAQAPQHNNETNEINEGETPNIIKLELPKDFEIITEQWKQIDNNNNDNPEITKPPTFDIPTNATSEEREVWADRLIFEG